MLDTFTLQFHDVLLNRFDPSLFDESKWAMQLQGPTFKELSSDADLELLSRKRSRAKLLQRGYFILLDQTTGIETSFDCMSDLSSFDLPMYTLNKDEYIKQFAQYREMSIEESTKHLEFLADSLMSVHFRKQTLVWKYSKTLRDVHTEEQLLKWRETLLTETIYLGQV
jgi:hypothetical protein